MNTDTFFAPVQTGLQEVELTLRSQVINTDDHSNLHNALDHLLNSGGKRVRPTLGLLIGQMFHAPHHKLVTLGAAVELLHTATLVHDDLIDGASLRRGMPTLNSRWSSAATVLTGDFFFARAAKLAAEIDHLPLMILFADTLTIIVNGELTQLFSGNSLISRENYYQRIYAKTASLFEMLARSAAMISPVSDDVVEAMRKFGYELGMAFQMVDDILDFTGEQVAVGKPVGSDLLHRIITLPTLYYFETHPDTEEKKILAGRKRNYERKRINSLVQAIRTSEAIQQSLDEAKQHIERALPLLLDMPAGIEKQALEDLACYIVDRQF